MLMSRLFLSGLTLMLLVSPVAAQTAAQTPPGKAAPKPAYTLPSQPRALKGLTMPEAPYLGPLPAFFVTHSEDKPAGSASFFDGNGIIAVEGKVWKRDYQALPEQVRPLDFDGIGSYAEALKSMGGEILFTGLCEVPKCGEKATLGRMLTGKVVKDKKETWFEVIAFDDGQLYGLTVTEKVEAKKEAGEPEKGKGKEEPVKDKPIKEEPKKEGPEKPEKPEKKKTDEEVGNKRGGE